MADLAGRPAPAFALVDLNGARVTLKSLLGPALPVLLVFIDLSSSASRELLPDLGGWQRVYGHRLTIALIGTGEPAKNRTMTNRYDVQRVLLQWDLEVVKDYGMLMVPAAVLVRPDGRVGLGPGYGPQAIRQLVADALGPVLPLAPPLGFQAVRQGDPTPRVLLPDLAGNVVDLASYLGEPVLIVFWSPGCGYCQELLPHVLAFEQAPNRLRMIVISGGSTSVNQELGFASPVILDHDRSLARAFGVSATPAAVLIGARGIVASVVAHGIVAVRAYVDRCRGPEILLTPGQAGP